LAGFVHGLGEMCTLDNQQINSNIQWLNFSH
jgi:hypothetical protein